ncbi:hypothetical protein Pfo_031027, partial [Paulownia fortunei]
LRDGVKNHKILKGITRECLLFKNHGHLIIEVYIYKWRLSLNIIDRRSTSGYCTFVGENLVTWRSKKQSVVARNSVKAELPKEFVKHCGSRESYRIECLSLSPIRVYCDNRTTILITHNWFFMTEPSILSYTSISSRRK